MTAKDQRGMEPFDYLLMNSGQKSISDGHIAILLYLLTQKEHPEALKHMAERMGTIKGLLFCIDNDAEEPLRLLLTHFADKFKTEVAGAYDYRFLLRRCLFLNSSRCLTTILSVKPDMEITPVELELAVYFANEEIVKDLITRFYERLPIAERKLEERVVKACVHKKAEAHLRHMLDFSKSCRYEFADSVAQIEAKDWGKEELAEIFSLDVIKDKRKLDLPNFVDMYAQYNDQNILQLAIDQDSESLASLLMQTDVSLWTNRKSDGATCLILATKVPSRQHIWHRKGCTRSWRR